MQSIKKIIELIDKSIDKNPEMLITGGNIIAYGYDETVDKYKDIISSSKDWLVSYQADLIKKTGITNLKIKFTGISGYFIEISKSSISKIPDYFIHKQTLINASRFVTQELVEFSSKLLEAETNQAQREYEIFLKIREEILDSFSNIKLLSERISYIDFLASLSNIAYLNNYSKPVISNDYDLLIEGARHPVIEKSIGDFISNDLKLTKKDYVHIITGPNMGGKSTFLRQNALIILLSHIGSFVPAKKAIIPITDKIFSRIGASDNLYLGQSTFMVEMQEVANILNNSNEKSFVIIDEIGRGTSTYDGMSLAWAILKENHDKIKAKTLFATHYHELIDESKNLPGVSNYSVAVGENEENLIFLRKIIPGGIKKSFGLEVAKIAGLNKEVINEASKMLKLLELEHNKLSGKQLSFGVSSIEQEIKYIQKKSEIEEEIKKIDLNTLTPIQALNKLSELKGKL